MPLVRPKPAWLSFMKIAAISPLIPRLYALRVTWRAFTCARQRHPTCDKSQKFVALKSFVGNPSSLPPSDKNRSENRLLSDVGQLKGFPLYHRSIVRFESEIFLAFVGYGLSFLTFIWLLSNMECLFWHLSGFCRIWNVFFNIFLAFVEYEMSFWHFSGFCRI